MFVKRDAFLKELTPFSDEPGNQRITLKIPPKLFEQQHDAKYLLRLKTTCVKKNIIVADIEIITNAPPIASDLIVSPLTGDALMTVFRFETTPAKDKPMDFPLVYYFGWLESSNEVNIKEPTFIAKFQDFYTIETVLPYIKETNGTLLTVMKVCDNKDSCVMVEGPKVQVKLPLDGSKENLS